MKCIICEGPISGRRRQDRRFCSESCRYRDRANKEGRTPHVPVTLRSGDGMTYQTIHRRVRYAFGPASHHTCANCGQRNAGDWAYDHRDTNETTDLETGLTYSIQLSHYLPMCRSCHREFDNAITRKQAQCGTEAGYYRHRRITRTPPCQRCKDAHADACRSRKARRLNDIHPYDQESA